MIELFNATNAPFTEAWYALLALLPLLWFIFRRITGRPATLWIPAIAIVLGGLVAGTIIWDDSRTRHMLATGEGLRTTRGIITNSWSITSRPRDWTKSGLSYKTVISEGFDIGDERFKWVVGGGYSGATFSNVGKPRIIFAKGSEVEVVWFADDAENGERRIVRLMMGQAPGNAPSPQLAARPSPPVGNGDFAAFQAEFAQAIQSGNSEGAKGFTQMPFAYGGNRIESAQFADLWQGLAMPQIGTCLARETALVEADGSRSIFCGETIFIFRRNASGTWRFAEIGAND